MPRRVVVTGIGMISAIGKNIDETLESLKNKRSGIGQISILNTNIKALSLPGRFKLTNEELSEMAGPDIPKISTRTTLLGLSLPEKHTVQQALNPGQIQGLKPVLFQLQLLEEWIKQRSTILIFCKTINICPTFLRMIVATIQNTFPKTSVSSTI